MGIFTAIGLAWKLGGFRGVVKLVPQWAWIALAVVILVLGSVWYHGHLKANFKRDVQRAQMAADNDYWKKKLAAAHEDALRWKGQYEQEQQKLAKEEQTRHEKVLADNAATADALRLRGPGKAGSDCRPSDYPKAVAGPSRPQQAAPAASPAATQVPSDDWALVPWRWLVNIVQQHDDVTDEARAWRNDKAKQNELYQQQVLQSAPGTEKR